MLTSHKRTFKFGDGVFHAAKPEWGPGTVTRAENIVHEGHSAQRLDVRFASAGLKTINTGVVDLVPAEEHHASAALGAGGGNAAGAATSTAASDGWLAKLENRRPADVMTQLPPTASDPFLTIWQRLQFTLDLYRFRREARSITEWAIAQSGLADPLARFNRHELETFFDRWARHRDRHLASLVFEASKLHGPQVKRMMAAARPEARQALQRAHARR